MIRVPLGTKEFLVVDVEDKLNQITDLTGTNPTFDVKLRDADPGDYVVEGQAASIGPAPMQLECLIDTATWVVSTYDLFVTFTNAPEAPRIGPFEFEVV